MTTKTKQAALKAARAELGEQAMEGVDFNLRNTGAGWVHDPIPAANEPAKKAWAAKTAKAPPQKTAAKAPKPAAPEGGTKTDMIMDMLTTLGGATSKEMEKATGWKPHSVRGLLGTLRAKGVDIISKKLQGEPTIYRVAKAKAQDPVGDVV